MIERRQIEGDYNAYNSLIQSPIISSTSPNYCTDQSPKFPKKRLSYRTTYPAYSQELNYPYIRNMAVAEEQTVGHRLPEEFHASVYIAQQNSISTRNSVVILIAIFSTSLLAMYIIYGTFPNLNAEDKAAIRIPMNLDHAKKLGIVLDKYKQHHYMQVLFGVCLMYIFLQTFAIPGSLFLSILSGFLFPFFIALTLICTCSAVGASLCFLISQVVGRKLVHRYFPEKANSWAKTVDKHRDNLLNYVIFLRVTPFLPNWFINLVAPVIGVPLVPFALGTFIGVAPPSFIAIQTGQTLHSMSATDSAFSWTSLTLLFVFAFLSIIPIYFKDKLKTKFE